MKRGTPRHPKVQHLAELLGQSIPTAIGYLELLWHFTAEFAPQGDIGRYDDRRIEAALHWKGRRGSLVSALLQAGWVDAGTPGDLSPRLVTHDWTDHCEDSVRKRLQRNNLPFLTITQKVTGQCPEPTQTLSENVCLPYPSPAQPSPLPIPIPAQAAPKPPPAANGHTPGTGTYQSQFENLLRTAGWNVNPDLSPKLARIATKAGVEPSMAAVVYMDIHRRSVNAANIQDLTAYLITAFKAELRKTVQPADTGLRKAADSVAI